MVQYGFVIDQTRCIGCHACTVACKSENDVPVGSFRTWVKYTEAGEFPEVRRSFAVLRCNQCTAAPCVTICPTSALTKRGDGIVDIDPKACIGCKSCLQGCPYDALYIHPAKGTAEKCHFCAHRTERGLAPACAVVCPTEAIVPGDFDDPRSAVSRLRDGGRLRARKEEAGTGPNVLYLGVAEAGIDPALTNAAGGYLWSDQREGAQLEADRFRAGLERSPARTSYDVGHAPAWGWKVGLYLFTKSLSAGILMAALPFLWRGLVRETAWAAGLALLFLALTSALLVWDLKRPERFLLILLRPNWRSWLVRGTVVLMVYGALLAGLLVAALLGSPPTGVLGRTAALAAALAGAGAAAYTGYLFAQAKGRVLWMQRGLWLHLVVQALAGGAAALLVFGPLLRLSPELLAWSRTLLFSSLLLHALFLAASSHLAPHGREKEFLSAHQLLTRGPYARRHWIEGVGIGIALPALLLLTPGFALPWSAAALAALYGLYVEEELFVQAGQALPIS